MPVRAGGQTGEPTDDVLVEFDDGARLFVQCKISVDITENVYAANGKKTPFASAWEQFGLQLLKGGSGVTTDCLVMAFSQWTGPLRELDNVLSRFRDHGGTLPLDHRRVAVPGPEKKTARKLLALLDELEKSPLLADLGSRRSEWLGKVYLHQLPLEREAESWGHLEDLIRSGVVADPAEAGRALGELFKLGDKAHVERTSFGLDQVRQALRLEGIWLKDVPNDSPDWVLLAARSRDAMDDIGSTLGENFCLPRSGVQSQIANAVEAGLATVVVGVSGTGKSAAVKAWATALDANAHRVVWLAGEDFDAGAELGAEGWLGLKRAPGDLFPNVGTRNAWLILDGLDRCFSEKAFRRVRRLVEACKLGEPGSAWRLLLICQDEEWGRVLRHLRSARVRLPMAEEPLVIPTLSSAELRGVAQRYPELAPLIELPYLQQLLSRPKILDFVRRHAGGLLDEGGMAVVSEADLAAWWWRTEVCASERPLARAAAVQEFAAQQASRGQVALRSTELGAEIRDEMDSLKRAGILRERSSRLDFTHDLYGDWSRVEILRSHDDDLGEFIAARAEQPLWPRAIRLHALGLLSDTRDDFTAWERVWLEIRGPNGEHEIASDIFLESVVFSDRAAAWLEMLWPRLREADGALLRRFLRRFLFVASVPDFKLVDELRRESGRGASIQEAAAVRRPIWRLWTPVIQFLHAHASEVVPWTLAELAKMAYQVLGNGPEDLPGRREMASLIVSAAEHCCRSGEHDRRWMDDTDKVVTQVYRAALRAYAEEPEKLREIIVRLCGLHENDWLPPEPPPPTPLAPANYPDDPVFREVVNWGLSQPLGGPVENWPWYGPWDDGPQHPVSDEFRAAFLKGDACAAMIEEDVAFAGKVLLATLIGEAHRLDPYGDFRGTLNETKGLQSDDIFEPPRYDTRPFQLFLWIAHQEGLAYLLRFVNFASERWAEQIRKLPVDSGEISEVTVPTERGPKQLFGCWRMYTGNLDAPWIHAGVRAALMAMEIWLKALHAHQIPVSALMTHILSESKSVGLAGVLITLGKRWPDLLWTELRSLVQTPELHLWEARRLDGQPSAVERRQTFGRNCRRDGGRSRRNFSRSR